MKTSKPAQTMSGKFLRGVIFYLDGTLADTLPLCIAAFRASIEPLAAENFLTRKSSRRLARLKKEPSARWPRRDSKTAWKNTQALRIDARCLFHSVCWNRLALGRAFFRSRSARCCDRERLTQRCDFAESPWPGEILHDGETRFASGTAERPGHPRSSEGVGPSPGRSGLRRRCGYGRAGRPKGWMLDCIGVLGEHRSGKRLKALHPDAIAPTVAELRSWLMPKFVSSL